MSWYAALVVLYGLVVTTWIVRRVFVRVLRRKMAFLTPDDPRAASTPNAPLVSVLIPAKDERHSIGPCLESILAQTYARLEVLVVDDRSEDGTGEIVEQFMRRDPRVRLLRNDHLPPGWTGKTHALWRGVAEASGEWLWFIDADTRHEPESLAVMLRFAARNKCDMVSMLMAMRNESFWERVVQPLAGIVLMGLFNLVRVNQNKHVRCAFANGQYILVRRDAYDSVGGHRAVRDQFVEDIQLGRRLKERGFRIKVAMGRALSSTRMYRSMREIVDGWSRIYYAGSAQRPWKLVLSQLSLALTSLIAFAVLPAAAAMWFCGHGGWPLAAVVALGALHMALMHNCMYHFYGFTYSDRRFLLFYPLACLMVVYILGRATKTCFTHRVTWRGTRYGRKRFVHPAAEGAGVPAPHILVHQR